MAITLKVLGLSVVIAFMLLKPSQSQQCHKIEQKNYGCVFHQLSSVNTWCDVASYDQPTFDLYIKPGDHFNGLNVVITKTDRLLGIIEVGKRKFSVDRNRLPEADKWYHIQFRSETTGWFNEKLSYTLSIDGQQHMSTELKLNQKATRFVIMIKGSPFYTTGTCNPGNYPPPSPTNPPPPPSPVATQPPPPPPPVAIQTPPPPTSLTPTELPEAVAETEITAHVNDLSTTENISNHPSSMEDAKHSSQDPSIEPKTLKILDEPWWIFVIIGVAVTIIIGVIITAVVMIKKWRGRKETETNGDEEEKDTSKIINNNDWQSQTPPPPPLNVYESDDPANHIYEEPEDYNVEEHIYETVEDLGGPITFVTGNGGQSMPHGVAWQTRRGSAHDSENSIYGCL